MHRILFLIIVTLNLYGCATPEMTVWDAGKIPALHSESINLRAKDGANVATVSRSQVIKLLDIKAKLERASSISGVQLVIADSKVPNAFANRDSTNPAIGLTIGMLNLIGHDYDAYAAIIGHELAHLALGHGAIRKEREDVAKGISNVVGNVLGAFIPMGGLITGVAVTAVTTIYSRDEERDADNKGVEYMKSAGFDPQGAVRVWEKMSNAGVGFSIPFLSTHPMSSERIENMRVLVATRQTNQTSIVSPRPDDSTINPAQSNLTERIPVDVPSVGKPACQGSDISTWTNCVGTHTFTYGTKYTGEWKYGNHHGQGTTYGQDGSILQSGIWENGKFVVKEAATPPPTADSVTSSKNGADLTGTLKERFIRFANSASQWSKPRNGHVAVALAIGKTDWAWASSKDARSESEATNQAMSNCRIEAEKFLITGPCFIYSVDERVWKPL